MVSRIWKEDTHETKVIADGLNNACSNGPVTEGEEVLWLRHTAFDEGVVVDDHICTVNEKRGILVFVSVFCALFDRVCGCMKDGTLYLGRRKNIFGAWGS